MENIVLTIGGLIKNFTWSDLFFFSASLILILLLVYIIYLIKIDEDETKKTPNGQNYKNVKAKENREVLLENIVDKLETDYEPKKIDLSRYEQEMEDTAIISYEELLQRSSNDIVYEDEYDSGIEDVVVKKIDSTNMSNTREFVDLPKAIMMNYDSEEAFLKALTVLQNNLVR